jgi:hypothetical protein
MESKKPAKTDDKLEKDLRTLVSRMKNENSALNKILNQLQPKEAETLNNNDSETELKKI